MKIAHIAFAAAALFMGAAHAAVFENNEGVNTNVFPFGSPDTTSYGQVFGLDSKQTVIDWTFYTNSGAAGDLSFVLAAWDGDKPVGPAIYKTNLSFAGGLQDLFVANINQTLEAGKYIAYMTVAGIAQPVSNVVFAGSQEDGGLVGGFRFLNSGGVDPLTLDKPWLTYTVPNLLYKANIVAAPVPEPEALAMLLAGLAGVGVFARRRQA